MRDPRTRCAIYARTGNPEVMVFGLDLMRGGALAGSGDQYMPVAVVDLRDAMLTRDSDGVSRLYYRDWDYKAAAVMRGDAREGLAVTRMD